MFVRKFVYWVMLSSLLLGLSSCSVVGDIQQAANDTIFGEEIANPPAELEEIKASYNATIDWSLEVGEPHVFDYTPALESGNVYSANSEGEIIKIDSTNGREVWRVSVGEPISGGVGAEGGMILVGSSKGNVYAYDVDGKQLWKSKLSSEILSVPRYFDGAVIVRSNDNHIYGLNAVDGTRKWAYERIVPALSLRSSAGIVVDGGAVYAGFAGGKMVAIRADNGRLLWESNVSQPKGVTEIERISDITSLPVVSGPVVYAVSYQGRVAAVDRTNGRVVWNREISSYSGMRLEDQKLFVSHSLGALYSLDYETGRTFWRQGELSNRKLTTPLPMGSIIAVGDLEGYIHFVSRDDGKFTARIQLNDSPVMSLMPGANASQLIAETRNGTLYAVSVK